MSATKRAFEASQETRASRFEGMMNNIATAQGNDTEIDTLRDLIWEFWHFLDEDQEVAFLDLDGVKAIEKRAQEWADQQEGDE